MICHYALIHIFAFFNSFFYYFKEKILIFSNEKNTKKLLRVMYENYTPPCPDYSQITQAQ